MEAIDPFDIQGNAWQFEIADNKAVVTAYEAKQETVGSATIYHPTLNVAEYDSLSAYKLPTITVDSAHAYIKAKEAQE